MNHLEKAKSAATQLARMTKAVADFHQKTSDLHNNHMAKVSALHKAHADDMSAAIGNVHKILGDESGELKSIDLEAGGTKNLQDFGANKAAGAANDAGATNGKGATATNGKGETVDEANGKGEKTMKASDIQEMIQKSVETSMGSFMEEFVKALTGADDEQLANLKKDQGGDGNGNGATVEKAMNGVGSRETVVRPIVRAGGGTVVTKANDATDVKPVAAEPVDVQKALGGDQEEALKLMRGAKKSNDIPPTLIEPMSKLH
jgi:hypothetical protein